MSVRLVTVRINEKHKLIILLSFIFVTSCVFFNTDTSLRSNAKVLGKNVGSTKLIVSEDYKNGGNSIPKGTYLPSHATTGGYIVYTSNKLLKVNGGFAAFGAKDKCHGGIAVNERKPYKDYYISVRNCLGDPNLRINIKTLKFKIVHAN